MFIDKSEQSRWFDEKLRPHEPMLKAWLTSRFPANCDIEDVIQEAYLRVLKAREKNEMEFPKAFLFATARNIALDKVKRPQFLRTEYLDEHDFGEFADEGVGVEEVVARNQELEIITLAVQSLPKRCRQVFTLAKIYGLSHKDIARKLSISERTVSTQLTRGFHKCVDFVNAYCRNRKSNR